MLKYALSLSGVVAAVAAGSTAATYAPRFHATCVCTNCQDEPAADKIADVLTLGEAYIRIKFGQREFDTIKPLTGTRYEREIGGDYWVVVGTRRNTQQNWIEVYIDAKTGCLLLATRTH